MHKKRGNRKEDKSELKLKDNEKDLIQLIGKSIYSTSKIVRFNPDCRMIDSKVPDLISLWFGTGIVIVESSVFFCIIIWLPRFRTSAKPF